MGGTRIWNCDAHPRSPQLRSASIRSRPQLRSACHPSRPDLRTSLATDLFRGPHPVPRAPSSDPHATHPARRVPFFQERTPNLTVCRKRVPDNMTGSVVQALRFLMASLSHPSLPPEKSAATLSFSSCLKRQTDLKYFGSEQVLYRKGA